MDGGRHVDGGAHVDGGRHVDGGAHVDGAAPRAHVGAAAPTHDGSIDAGRRESVSQLWAEEEEDQEWDGEGVTDEIASRAEISHEIVQLLLQTVAELSAVEATHAALVSIDELTDALLAIASSTTTTRRAQQQHDEGQSAEPSHQMEAVVALSNLAENPETHKAAFDGARGEAAFALFVNLLQALTAAAVVVAVVVVGSSIAVGSRSSSTYCRHLLLLLLL